VVNKFILRRNYRLLCLLRKTVTYRESGSKKRSILSIFAEGNASCLKAEPEKLRDGLTYYYLVLGMRKTGLALALILALLLFAVIGEQSANLAGADPFFYYGEVPPKADTTPPVISMSSPENNTVYNVNYVALTFSVSGPTGPNVNAPFVDKIYYRADWLQNTTYVYDIGISNYYTEVPDHEVYTEYSNNLNLTGIPEGNHSITLVTVYHGFYIVGITLTGFYINSSSVVNFTINTPPSISVLSPQNKTYSASIVPLNLALDSPITQISYSLDGQENVTITGNTTLTVLFNGAHNVTVYAQDDTGNIGASETIPFIVADEPETEPFPTAYSMGIVAVIVLVLLGATVYVLKRKH
jgi:hypothetical protein